MSLVEFLRRRVFTPLGMTTVVDTDEAALGPGDPMRYLRYALGPPRPAPKEGKGWMFAAGELAMTARDLARWDIATIDQTILKPESYQAMQANTVLRNGARHQLRARRPGRRRGRPPAGVAHGRGVGLHGGATTSIRTTGRPSSC